MATGQRDVVISAYFGAPTDTRVEPEYDAETPRYDEERPEYDAERPRDDEKRPEYDG